MNNLIDIENAIKSLPEEYSEVAHKAEEARYELDKIEQNLELREAKLTLTKMAKVIDGETQKARETRIKCEVIDELHSDTMEVLKAKSTYKKLELDAEVISKKIVMLCKSSDLFLAEQYQTGRLEKAQKPVIPTNFKSELGR